MGPVCSWPEAKQGAVFDPKDYMLIAEHESEVTRNTEQKNLLRFKVEVLINMLAIEEKKKESLTKRIEVMKWTMLSNGVNEDGLNGILKTIPDARTITNGDERSPAPAHLTSAIDLGGAIERLGNEFVTNKRDIVQSFADEDGKVVTSLSRDQFMRQLYAATEHVSKADIHAISLRFFDGSIVSIVEFIEFFMTPIAVRQAKAAAAAVRMSLDLLQLEQNIEEGEGSLDYPEDDDEHQMDVSASHNTLSLDSGTRSLSSMWGIVCDDVCNAFEDTQDLGDQVVLLETFTSVLESVCGVNTKSTTLIKAAKTKDDVRLLTKQEIDILAERFEIGGRVHYGHFIQFFKEMNNSKSFNRTKSYKAVDGSVQSRSTRPKQSVGLSPFRMSSEWASLKEDVFKNKTYKLNDNSRPLDSVSERGKGTYRGQSSTDIRNSNSKGRIEMLSEEDDDDENEQPYDQSSPHTPTHNTSSKQNFRERVRDRRDSRSSAGQDEWRASKDRNLGSSSPSDSKYPGKNKNNKTDENYNEINTKIAERGRSQKNLVNNSNLSDGKKNVPPPKPARNIPGKRNDAPAEKDPKKSSEENRKNNRNRDNNDGYYNNKNNSNSNHYDNNSNSNDDDDDDDNYNRGMSDKKRAILGNELDFKNDSRGRSDSPRDLRDRNNNNNKNQSEDNDRRRSSNGSDRGRGSERGRRSLSEAKNIPGKDRGSERDRDRERGSERGRERRSRSPDGRSSPENVAVNRRSWRRSLTDSMMWTKSQTMLVDDDDTSGPLKLPQRAQSPEGKGVTKYFPWNRRSGGDSGRSSPVAL